MQSGVRHIFGTTTSASRKEIIPDLEQNAGLLWYACPYEGFESSEHVLYLGGCPNQTLIPLLRYALQTFGKRAVLLGSNYSWGWESNRVAREVLEVAGAEVLLERYIHLDATPFSELIQTLLAERPAFILNNLIGKSSYAFLQQLDAACNSVGWSLPVLSCNLTEAELSDVGDLRSLRVLSCGPFLKKSPPRSASSSTCCMGCARFRTSIPGCTWPCTCLPVRWNSVAAMTPIGFAATCMTTRRTAYSAAWPSPSATTTAASRAILLNCAQDVLWSCTVRHGHCRPTLI